jgi:hypothetical protein
MGVRRILAGALAAPLLLLSACGGGDDSVADPPVSSAPTSSDPTERPQPESVSAFIHRWVREDTRMQNTGDTGTFLRMSRNCEGCISVAKTVSKIYGHGGRIRTRGWTLVSTRQSGHSTHLRTIDLVVDSAPTDYIPSRGSATKHLNGGREHFQIQLVSSEDSWRVSRFVEVSS